MNQLNLSENIIKLRHNKGVTQDQLATFLNVTKASVSKWETKLSYPDILLLPQIATYFDVSIDELLGYEPQMSSEQIRKCYLELADDFAKLPYDEVIKKTEDLAKAYYSCYPLLLQVAILWLNHYMLTADIEKQKSRLSEIVKLCERIYENSKDVALSSNAIELKAVVNLSLGNAQQVIEEIEPLIETKQLMFQIDPILIQAYKMTGDISKATLYNQINIYKHLMGLISNSIGMLDLYMTDKEMGLKTISRIKKVITAYDLIHLNANVALQFFYQSVVFYCANGLKDKALNELNFFVTESLDFIQNDLSLHGDKYFDRIEEWFNKTTLKTQAPRNQKVILESLIPALENPAFSILFETEEYKSLKIKVEIKIKELYKGLSQ